MTEVSLRGEALRLVSIATEHDVPLRVLGGVAVELLVPNWRGRGERPGRDLDMATTSAGRRRVLEMLEAEGYVPDRRYNAAAGHKQLYAVDPERGRPIDVIVDRLEMCHTLDLRPSLAGRGPTIFPADLLLSKLQVVKVTRKDLIDARVLLSEIPLADADASQDGYISIATAPIIRLTARDWGWWRTVIGTLDTLLRFVAEEPEPVELALGRPPRYDAAVQAHQLVARLGAAPKSLTWKARARIGDRARWFEEPEEESHH